MDDDRFYTFIALLITLTLLLFFTQRFLYSVPGGALAVTLGLAGAGSLLAVALAAVAGRVTTAALFYRRGRRAHQRGDRRLAIRFFSRSIELLPELPHPYIERSAVYADLHNLDRALADLDKALAIDPRNTNALIQRGRVFELRGDLARALNNFNLAIKLNPSGPGAYLCRADIFTRLGDLRRSLADLDLALQLNPRLWQAYVQRGLARCRLNDPSGALQDFDLALARKPHNVEAHHGRALAFLKLGQLAQAEAECRLASALAPNDPFTHARWGALLYARGEAQAALERYRRAAAGLTDPTRFHLEQALALLQLDRPDEAAELVRKRLARDPRPRELAELLPLFEALAQSQPAGGEILALLQASRA